MRTLAPPKSSHGITRVKSRCPIENRLVRRCVLLWNGGSIEVGRRQAGASSKLRLISETGRPNGTMYRCEKRLHQHHGMTGLSGRQGNRGVHDTTGLSALPGGSTENATMDVHFINPFVEGVDSVFQTMLQVEPKRCPVQVGHKGNGHSAALTSLVGISGQVQGVVVLRFPPETALQLASRMLGTNLDTVNDEVVDAIAEIVNMVAGSAKAKFNCDPPLDLGLPTVVLGSNYKVKYPSGATWLKVPFESEAGNFTLELTFESH